MVPSRRRGQRRRYAGHSREREAQLDGSTSAPGKHGYGGDTGWRWEGSVAPV